MGNYLNKLFKKRNDLAEKLIRVDQSIAVQILQTVYGIVGRRSPISRKNICMDAHLTDPRVQASQIDVALYILFERGLIEIVDYDDEEGKVFKVVNKKNTQKG